ncbi:PKD domain-containing protein [uncultured Polaribacter sp.]|uniref:PKD domain-containing protein n=1 Tax=uncultured Polaribacter sp. TaxID=174711 RepID=UPI0030D82270|tara:strand:- start:17631 stop:18578 length:948 start_codon:yes stop_codon:yes gene_type:complete
MKNIKKQVAQAFLIVFVLLVGATMTSCSDMFEFELPEANSKPDLTPPSANFKATGTTDYLTFTFSNLSISATTYLWDFGLDGDGDGEIDTFSTTDAEYTFPGEGIFTVTLTASDKLGVVSTFSSTVEVIEPIVPPSIYPEILNGDFNEGTSNWKPSSFTGRNTNAFNASSDGDPLNYDGTPSGSTKTPGAKWTSSTSAGPSLSSSTRFAYQAITVSPNTNYIIEYSYAIKTDKDDIEGGDRVLVDILDGWYADGADAEVSTPLVQTVGDEANGKGNFKVVKKVFSSNATGEIAIWIYAITNDELYVDNVKVYPVN